MTDRKPKRTSPIRHRVTRLMRTKLVLLFGTIVVAFVFLVGKVTYINATNGDIYTKIVLDQQQYNSRIIPFKRGDILDRNGNVVATSTRVYNVILDSYVMLARGDEVDREAIRQVKEALEICFEIDGEAVDEVVEKRPNSRYNIMKKTISYAKAQEFKALLADTENYPYLSCVWLEEDYVRTYPYNSLACDVIGFTVAGNIGNAGLEASYNSLLNGTNGREYGYLDADSSLERIVKNAINGKNVVSTIDITLQSIVEKHILAFNEAHKNEAIPGEGSLNTAVIIMNPNTGEILAEASYPNYDLNNPRDLSKYYSESELTSMKEEDKLRILNKLWNNFCVSDTYEPGSTAKPFTMAAALECKNLSGKETYQCKGYTVVADHVIRCSNYRSHGTESLSDIIANSCNVAMISIADSLGAKAFCKYQSIFSFGQKTGIDLPGEAETSGLLYNAENMGPVELATSAFGQSFNVTMTQMVAGFSSLINGGYYYQPHIVKQIQDENGNVLENKNSLLLKKTVSEETSEMLRTYMKQTMTSGTGQNAQVKGYSIGGKTGTAEKLPRDNGKYLLSFMGFAPAENPEVLIYVVIDEPNVEKQATSSLVTDLSREIMKEAFEYLNIPKSK